MRKQSFYFDPDATGVAVFLGPTEARLMNLAWEKGPLTVKKALFHLGSKNERAYTTVMTVLGRLAEKGLLKKTKEGRLFVYEPATGKDEFVTERLRTIDDCLKRNFRRK
jgi:predicted transcriptional regulator